MLWVPENVRGVFVPNFIVWPMQKPWLFDESKGSVEFRTCWIVFGRPGLNIAEGITNSLAPFKQQFKITGRRVPLDHGAHYPLVQQLDTQIEEQEVRLRQLGVIDGSSGLVIILDRAHLLMHSKDPLVTQWVTDLVEKIRGLHIIVIMCVNIPTRSIPEEMRINYQYQGKFHYTPPDPQWIEKYLKFHLVDSFKSFLDSQGTSSDLQRVSFELSEDDLKFLTECCDYATTDELYGFCNMVKTSLHRPRPSDNAEIVLNLKYCKHFLKTMGGCLRISEVVGYDAMQPFWESSGEGFPDPPQRSEATIIDKAEYYRHSGGLCPPIMEETTKVLTTREEVTDHFKGTLIQNPYVEEEAGEENEPLKKRKIE
jgi:hypothetical protein